MLASSVMPALGRTPLRRFIPERFVYRSVVLNAGWMAVVSSDDGAALLEELRKPVALQPGDVVLEGEVGRIGGMRFIETPWGDRPLTTSNTFER